MATACQLCDGMDLPGILLDLAGITDENADICGMRGNGSRLALNSTTQEKSDDPVSD